MLNRITAWFRSTSWQQWTYRVLLAITVLGFAFAPVTGNGYTWLFWGGVACFAFAARPSSKMHLSTIADWDLTKRLLSILVALVTIACCILPMDQLPLWNGEQPGHRNQYELMADALLDGRIDFAYGDEDTLAGLENPYDPDERKEAGVYYHWDHAYYNGKYYMYFGIVPVFLAFLPYKLFTGRSLTTYQGTQIFTALTIAGIFVLFHLLTKVFFKKMSFGLYLCLCVAFSVMSVWYSTAEPALYCTAITAALALEVWSLYFFIRGVWYETKENQQLLYAGVGAFLGALVFGCRPPIALANLLVIPMLITFLGQRKFSLKLLGKLALAALPYVVIGTALMMYNYVRFEDPFEFGQAYQLTVADQSQYQLTLDKQTLLRLFNNTTSHLFGRSNISETFPYLNTASVFANFPILLLLGGIFKTEVLSGLRQTKTLPLIIGIAVTVLLITAVDILWTPYLLERYRMDIYFLLGIGCFVILGFWQDSCTLKNRKRFSTFLCLACLATVVSSYLLCINTVAVYYPDKVSEIARIFHLS